MIKQPINDPMIDAVSDRSTVDDETFDQEEFLLNQDFFMDFRYRECSDIIDNKIFQLPIFTDVDQKLFYKNELILNKIYDSKQKIEHILFLITGAHLTQKELLDLRKTIFAPFLPVCKRDEYRSKIKNIEVLEKYKSQLTPLLGNPNIQNLIRNYVFERRRVYEKADMAINFLKISKKMEGL